MFDLQNSYADIAGSDVFDTVKMLIGTMMFSDESILTVIPEEMKDKTWQEIADTVKTPWGMAFPSQEIVDAANLSMELFDESKWQIHSLWEGGKKPVFNNTKDDVCLFTPTRTDDVLRPAVILCPGGAYTTISMVSEGFMMAQEFLKRGYQPYILRYRRLPNLFPCPQEDLTLALLHVKANAQRDHIDSDNLMLVGFSAGGHLCASTVTMLDAMKEKVLSELEDASLVSAYRAIDPMPRKMVLGYAVTGSDTSLMEKLCPDKAQLDLYDSYKHITANTPKAYAWACADDPLVPARNTTQWGEAMESAGLECRYRIFPTGGHGIAAGYGTSAEGWLDDMFEYFK